METDSVSIELPGAGIRPWDQLLRDVRELEMRIDTRIAQYMQFVQPTAAQSPAGNSAARTDKQQSAALESEIATILGDLDAVISEMKETVQHRRGSARVLERHQSMYTDYVREFQRYQANVQAAAARSELLAGTAPGVDLSDRDRMVDERMRIDQTHADIDMVLDNAFSVHRELSEQRSVIGGATARMVDVSERIPGLNMLLGRIRSRKRKEKVVLALVISVCTCILLFVLT
ncbi:protein transport protein gos1 [Coemansia sp. RSA 2711]|nr:protein transport protein gos1 [Coemansia sp. RSA 2711]KAJ1846946.1 protein transport protein gos1 [Coemansia sp. RSA 2708]KAJ2366380.1 protein transport protein gos1 [Coemansia sp. RSA 2610]KAJ2389152.1 protein transport protein gos1 [Coemansia sp. RSA 2611]KAJ2729577.1 protein transport protein gos1 [Coemansia sp. Cherry 401B]